MKLLYSDYIRQFNGVSMLTNDIYRHLPTFGDIITISYFYVVEGVVMTREQLEELIIKTDKKNENRKLKRFIKAYLLFVVMYAVFFYWIIDDGILNSIGLAAFVSIFHIFINLYIYNHIFEAANAENAYLKSLKKKYYDEYGGYM